MNYSKNIRRIEIAKRIIVSWVIIAIIFLAIGLLIGHIISYKDTGKQKSDKATVEALNEKVVIYGKYEEQLVSGDVDWEVPNDFTPLDVNMNEDIQEFVYCICKSYDMDFTFVMAVIKNESNYQSDVKSNTGDWGLMQINEQNFDWLSGVTGVTNYLNPYQNVIAGCYILHNLFEKYEEPNKVLMAYNFGERQASILWDQGITSSEYSRKVLEIQNALIKSEEQEK